MDKSEFKMQTFKQADLQQDYWKTRTMEERLQAAMEMTKAAYQIGKDGFSPMDKTLTSCRKRNG